MTSVQKNTASALNKSAVTNLIALIVILLGYLSPWFGAHIRSVGFFALSGAITNWLAIHMLFEKVRGLYGSGVVPNHFEDFKRGIRQLIMDQFFTKANMHKFLADTLEQSADEFDIEPALDAIEYDKAFQNLVSMIMQSSFGGMLGMFGGQGALEGFREPFEENIKAFIREQAEREEFRQALLGSGSGKNEEGIDTMVNAVKSKVELIVESRLDELTPQMVKQIVKEMIAKHLGWLVVWGGVFGGAIGLVMSLIPA
ncbi:MAG: DUF445 domain-containing protein [Spirochaetia bacterium]|nr:DUF445 domain-containing protein [Spirochaetia bacterium]